MKYKKSFLIICLIISLFSIASVMAGEVNETILADDCQSDNLIEIENQEESDISSENEAIVEDTSESESVISKEEVLSAAEDNVISSEENDEVITSPTVNEVILETDDVTGSCDGIIHYKVRVFEDGFYKSGLLVNFICNGKEYSDITDEDGYATLDIHLKSGVYPIIVKYAGTVKANEITVNKKFVSNVYKNVKIKSANAYYKQNKKITFSFDGNLNGYLKIYKGSKAVYSKKINTNGYTNDYFTYKKHSYTYPTKKLTKTGQYTAKILRNDGKVVAKFKFKITKAPIWAVCDSFTTIGGFKESIRVYIYDNDDKRSGIGGTAKFKIKGKTYKAKVKNGFAKVKVKFPSKKKSYKCSVKFSGDKHYKSDSVKFKIKTLKIKNPIKVGKYKIKLNSKQYKKLSKVVRNGKSISMVLKTKYMHKVKKPYTKTVRKYKTTKSCKTLYAISYMETMNRMWDNGWSKVSEYTYDKVNPQNKYGIGLSSYTYAVTKWVKVYYKTAYKTKYYPVKAKIVTKDTSLSKPKIKIYSHGKTLRNGKVSFA